MFYYHIFADADAERSSQVLYQISTWRLCMGEFESCDFKEELQEQKLGLIFYVLIVVLYSVSFRVVFILPASITSINMTAVL